MKLKISVAPHHEALVPALCWDSNNELVTASDDKTLCRWDMSGEMIGKVTDLEAFVTDMHWAPSVGKTKSETFAMSCADGTFRIMSSTGREEKRVEAHKGCAVISLRWNYDGSAIATAGEEGVVKVWSRVGMLRNTVVSAGSPVYCVAWGPDDNQILYSSGQHLTIKTLQKERKEVKWKAHDNSVLTVDWNPVNNLIVSGGEDCKYRVWDAFGRQLYASQSFDHVVTAVKWSPNGSVFAVGAFNILRLCDRTGWSYCRDEPASGSIMNISWTSDGTLFAGAGGNGGVVFAQSIERSIDWKHMSATLIDVDTLQVTDNLHDEADFSEKLEFRDRVIEFSMAYDYIVVATATQIHIFRCNNLNTPHIFDVQSDTLVQNIVQAEKYFLTVDSVRGVQVYSYEGRRVSVPAFPGMRVEFLNSQTIALSSNTVAILDRADNRTVRLIDAHSGRPVGAGKMTHTTEIIEIRLSQMDSHSASRFLVIVDRNRDLYIAPVSTDVKDPRKPYKLHTMVDAACWNDRSDMLSALADGKVITWYYPQVVWVDGDLLPNTRVERDVPEFGKAPQIVSFFGTRIVVRRADGSLLTTSVSPYPSMLFEFVNDNVQRWEDAVRLCRFVQSESLWATLAAMAVRGLHLDTAEIALAAIDAVDKLHYILYMKDIPSEKGRMAELALYRRDVESAEQILLHANPPLVYRAIKMNVRLCRWERALELAAQHSNHVDTVLWYRQKFLETHGRTETIQRFVKLAKETEINEEDIKARKAKEKSDEMARYGGGGGGGGSEGKA